MCRVLQRCIALAILILSAPILLVSVLAILIVDRQYPIFVQDRVGLCGRKFAIWKLRTMKGTDEEWIDDEKAAHDIKQKSIHRITRVGSVLRRWSIDELPQLCNVLMGDMDLVGPRPLLPVEARTWYSDYLDVYESVRPGVTGLWQVSGRSDTSHAKRVELDLEYIRNKSCKNDISIILRTVMVVLGRKGAY